MFSVLFPLIPLGPFAFSQTELTSLLNTTATLPHSQSSLRQPNRKAKNSGGYGWHKVLHRLFLNTCLEGETAETFIVNMLLQTSSLITEQLQECCSADFATLEASWRHFGNLSKIPPNFWPNSNTLDLYPNLMHSLKKKGKEKKKAELTLRTYLKSTGIYN